MGFILKNTSGLINTRLTDTARQKLSQGSFNISYFQIGDSEVTYNTFGSLNLSSLNILEPNFNSQNSTGSPQNNKQNIKYPYYVDGTEGNTYGIPYLASDVSPIYNSTTMRGFFTGETTNETITSWSALTDNQHVINSNYVIDMSTLDGYNNIILKFSGCNTNIVRQPSIGDFITIYYDGNGYNNCSCDLGTPITPTPTPTPTVTPSYDECIVYPTPTPSSTCCLTPTPSCGPEPITECVMSVSSGYTILTYKIVDICNLGLTVDRLLPNFTNLNEDCYYARTLIYPPNMTSLYDSITPSQHWSEDIINFESICTTDEFDVKIWNMNIPWSESPAGLNSSVYKDYTKFGSTSYLGTKEYLGYMSNSGQTINNTVNYVNSLGDVIIVPPKDQKSISIIHYTNQSIDLFYGEKFALEPYDNTTPEDTTGEGRNFRLHMPTLMWHKSPTCGNGQTFWVDPPGFDSLTISGSPLFKVNYIRSTKNVSMNQPGIRYYNLWDTNINEYNNGYPNRVGKVFPDQKIIVIDDEEIIAALSYKSNRNWTLPSPRISLIAPNTCEINNGSISVDGVLSGSSEYMYVTYRLSNSELFTNSLHCNYYSKIRGTTITPTNLNSNNVGIRFGNEFPCLNQIPELSTTLNTGFVADTFEIICQKVTGDVRPDPSLWRVIDFTSMVSATTINGYITVEGLTGTTFIITSDDYDNAENNIYDLDYLSLPENNYTGTSLNFGDEYYFYGALETDIQATIYEMKYKVNLSATEFQATSNPTWSSTVKPYISEIGLYDDEDNLMIISKLQSPVLRQGLQQFLIKFDF